MAGTRFRRLIEAFTNDLDRQGAAVIPESVSAERPARLRVDGQRFLVFLWTITPGGGPTGVRPPHERRIQITKVTGFPLEPESRTLIGGWSDECCVYAFWDARRHAQFSHRSPSFQVDVGTLQGAANAGLATQPRPTRSGSQEMVVAVSPKSLLWYLRSGLALHNAPEDADAVADLITAAPEEERQFLDSDPTEATVARRYDLVQVIRAFRAASFRPMVLEAYSYRCAVCGVALKLVDAAHIVPVAYPGSTDEVTNGLGLCRLHHAAYDSGLLGILPNYSLGVRDASVTALRRANLDHGITEFRAALPPRIRVPATRNVRPLPANLRTGLLARGWVTGSF